MLKKVVEAGPWDRVHGDLLGPLVVVAGPWEEVAGPLVEGEEEAER